MEPKKGYDVLLVEDSPSDAILTREALRDVRDVEVRLHVVSDGVEAMAFLRREGHYAAAPRPDLVLLDLNLPRKDGREVLAEAKSDPRFQTLPIVVLTSSSADSDLSTAYERHANSYLIKPTDFSRFRTMMSTLVEFWLKLACGPPR